MLRARVVAAVRLAILIGPLLLIDIACSLAPEQQLLTQFFRAARDRDNEALVRMSSVPFDPRARGAVEDFEIVSVSEEQRTPLDVKALLEAQAKARSAEAESTERTPAAGSAGTGQSAGPVEALLNQPGQQPFSPTQFTGHLLSKHVTVNAQVRSPDGQVGPKTLVLTMQRALGTLNGQPREGRWIITRIDEG